MTAVARVCAQCPTPLTKKPGPGRWPRYCSAACRTSAARSARCDNEAPCIPCAHCGAAFSPGSGRRYCAPRCRSAAGHARTTRDGRYEARKTASRQQTASRRALECCRYCDGPMEPFKRAHCGSDECKRQYNNERTRTFMRRYKAEHGVSYVRKYRKPGQDEERFALLEEIKRRDPERAAARKQESWHRRRARKRMAPFDRFRHADVYERDAWVCQLCSRVVNPDLRHPDPLSASLDHKLPLAKGGHHVWDNVQLAHLTCNVTKKDRIDWTPEAA